MARSKDRQEDERREADKQSRVNKTHGGEMVEAIAQEDLESFNDADCKHQTLILDPSETEFRAFVCANPKCSEVVLFKKP